MMWRDLLIASGVDERDIEKAVRDSRTLVRRVSAGARVLSKGLERAAIACKPGTRRQTVALIGSACLQEIASGTEAMLRPRPKGGQR